jgi:hypothetical protein
LRGRWGRTAGRRPIRPSLTAAEQEPVLAVLRSDGFVNRSPAQVWAVLLDEGTYLSSISTMYRLLRRAGEVRERRRQRWRAPMWLRSSGVLRRTGGSNRTRVQQPA